MCWSPSLQQIRMTRWSVLSTASQIPQSLTVQQNWTKWWKFSAMSLATLVSFTQGFGPLALPPMFPQLIEAFDSDLASVVQFVGVCILVLGFSNFIWYVHEHSLCQKLTCPGYPCRQHSDDAPFYCSRPSFVLLATSGAPLRRTTTASWVLVFSMASGLALLR